MQKFGGSSLASLAKIQNVASIVKQQLDKGNQIICVVSAMGTDTDELFGLAHQLSPEPPRRELDMLLSSGERKSAALLSIALTKMKYKGYSLTGSQCGILTDRIHGNARIRKITGERIRQALENHSFVIVAGYQGVCPDTKEITTLGRGGSDLTAVALTISLGAKECQIYTDVDGIMTADPRVVSSARTVSNVSWSSMSRLACAGAQVLHYRAAYLAQKYQVPLKVLSSIHSPPTTGTLIQDCPLMEKAHVVSIAHKLDQAYLVYHFKGTEIRPLLNVVTTWLWEKDELSQVLKVSTDVKQKTFQVELIVSSHLLTDLHNMFSSTSDHSFQYVGHQVLQQEGALVTLVGTGFKHSPEFSSDLLSGCPSEPMFIEIEEGTVRLLWDKSSFQTNVDYLHREFILNKKGD